tara:strand:+ start:7006 stop:8010 length:1005 start_codon:yes stop_codon:yes gene_type:complete
VRKNTLIYGGGAIGSFLAACLIKSNHNIIFLCRGKTYKFITKNGLNIKVYNNSSLKKKFYLKSNKSFQIINKIDKIKIKKIDNIFITTSINENIIKILNKTEKYIGPKTLIVPPCTAIPFWWHKCLSSNLQQKIEKKMSPILLKNLKRKNLVGMTMWLSGKIESPGNIRINHIQRGFPIKEVFKEKSHLVDALREDLKKTTLSPKVKNIYSEIFIKSINSLAFNMIALKYFQNNYELNKNIKAKKEVIKILREGDEVLKKFKIKVYQSPSSRVIQTLRSSKHTMSMLNALKNNKKIELKNLWLSFKNLKDNLQFKMEKTERTYRFLEKKLDEFI